MYEKSRLIQLSRTDLERYLNGTWRGFQENKMEGTIKTIIVKKQFGFIKAMDGKEYFMHKSSFRGHWDDLVIDFNNDEVIKVAFDVEPSPKGPRAKDVVRVDFPNEGTR